MLKKTVIAFGLFLTMTSCTNGGGSYFLYGTRALLPDCSMSDVDRVRGSIDLSLTSSYVLVMQLETQAIGDPVIIDGREVSGATQNDFVADDMVINYDVVTNGQTVAAGIPEQHVAMLTTFPAGTSASQGSFLSTNVITPEAATALLARGGFPYTAVVKVYLRGATRGGLPVSTNTLRYPITVTNDSASTVSCPAATPTKTLAPACNPGQDFSYICS